MSTKEFAVADMLPPMLGLDEPVAHPHKVPMAGCEPCMETMARNRGAAQNLAEPLGLVMQQMESLAMDYGQYLLTNGSRPGSLAEAQDFGSYGITAAVIGDLTTISPQGGTVTMDFELGALATFYMKNTGAAAGFGNSYIDDYSASLQAYWKMEETGAANRTDEITTNDAVPTNAPGTRAGINNLACNFVGASSQKLTVPNHADISPVTGFAISFWAVVDGAPSREMLLDKGGINSAYLISRTLQSKVDLQIHQSDSTLRSLATTVQPLTGGYHNVICMACDGFLHIYVDGVDRGDGSVAYDNTILVVADDLKFGSPVGLSAYLTGAMDEVGFWKDITFPNATARDNFAAAHWNGGLGVFYDSAGRLVLDVQDLVRSDQFESTIAAGTAPFVVASNTVVASLNADLLDGNHAAAFAPVGHLHDTQTLEHDAVNSDGGAFPFDTTGTVTFNNYVHVVMAAGVAQVKALSLDNSAWLKADGVDDSALILYEDTNLKAYFLWDNGLAETQIYSEGTLLIDPIGDITVADGSGINVYEDITWLGATTENLAQFPDNLPVALRFAEGANPYFDFISMDGSEEMRAYYPLCATDFPKTGWPVTPGVTLSFDNANRRLTVTDGGAAYYYIGGVRYTLGGNHTVDITDTAGLWYIYFVGSTLTASQTIWDFTAEDKALVAIVYWDATNNEQITLGYELHNFLIDGSTHGRYHFGGGSAWDTGLLVFDAGAEDVNVEAGVILDEDITIAITDGAGAGLWEQLLSPAELPIYYRSGASDWRLYDTGDKANATDVGYVDGGNDLHYNKLNGVWASVAAGVGKYVAYYVIASNDQTEPVALIMGQRTDNTLAAAKANNIFSGLSLAGLPFEEMVILARLILKQTAGGLFYTLEDIVDLRAFNAEGNVTSPLITSHAGLSQLEWSVAGHYFDAAVDFNAQNLQNCGNIDISNGAEVRFWDVGDSHYVGFEAPALAASQIWILPTVDGNANEALITNGAGTLSWAAGGGGGFTWIQKAAAYTAVDLDGILLDSTGGIFTITLPLNPTGGESIAFSDAGSACGTNNVTIARNGELIQGNAGDMIIDFDDASFALVFDATYGWRLDPLYATSDPTGFVDRGDPAANDYDQTTLTADGAWHALDLSAIVPAGAKAIAILMGLQDNLTGQQMLLRKNGNAQTPNRSHLWTQVANLYQYMDMVVPCDTDRKVEYLLSNTVWTAVILNVKGWWF